MSREIRQESVVILQTYAVGESSLYVRLFSKTSGILRAFATQARNSRKRFSGGLSVGFMGEAELVQQGEGNLRLQSFTLTFPGSLELGRDIERFAYVGYACELTEQLVLEHEPEPQLFAALEQLIAACCTSRVQPGLLRHYELSLLQALGHMPSLASCCVCGEEVHALASVSINMERGGVVCSQHAQAARQVEGSILRTLLDLSHATDLAVFPDTWAELTGVQRKTLRDLLWHCLRPHLRSPLRSIEFFAKIAGSSPSSV